MKFSKYNTSLFYDEKFLFHNSYTESYLLLEPILMDLINASTAENNPAGLAEVHPELF